MARKERHERAPISGASEKPILLTGPVGRPAKRHRTYPGFPEAATYLRNLFITVLDPSDVLLSATMNTPYREHVEHHLGLFHRCHGIVTLPGWDGTVLSQSLVTLAHGCRLPIFHMGEYGGLEASQWGHPDPELDWIPRPAEEKRIL